MKAQHPVKGKRLRNQTEREAHYGLIRLPGDPARKVPGPIPLDWENETYQHLIASQGRYDCTWRGNYNLLLVKLTLRDGSVISYTWRRNES